MCVCVVRLSTKKNNSIQVWRRRRETNFLTFWLSVWPPRTTPQINQQLERRERLPRCWSISQTRLLSHFCAAARRRARDDFDICALTLPPQVTSTHHVMIRSVCVLVIIPACQTRFDCYRRHVPLIINPPLPPPTHTNKHKQHVNIIQRLPVSVSMPVCLFNWARKRLIQLKTSVFLSDELSKDT